LLSKTFTNYPANIHNLIKHIPLNQLHSNPNSQSR